MSILRKAAKGFFEGAGEFQKEVLKDQMANRGWMRRQKYLEGVEAAKYARNRSGQQEDWENRADITRKSNLSVRATKLASTLLSAGSNKYKFDNTGNLRGNDVTAVAQLIDGFMRGSYTNGKPVPEAQASELAMSVITSKMRGVDDKSLPKIPHQTCQLPQISKRCWIWIMRQKLLRLNHNKARIVLKVVVFLVCNTITTTQRITYIEINTYG